MVGGVVTHRQRPATAGGTMFINLEDETGLINVVCSLGCWIHHRAVARGAPALLVRGRLERAEGVTNIVAERLDPLPVPAAVPYCVDLIGGPYIETDAEVCAAFRPKSAQRPPAK